MCEIITRFLPEKKSEFIRQQYDNIPLNSDPLKLYTYSNVTIIPLGYVEEACKHPQENRIVDDLDLCADITPAKADTEIENSCVLYCGYLHTQVWGHFLTNSLARLWPVANTDLSVDKYVFVSESNVEDESEISGNYAEVFRLLGMAGKIEIIKEPKAFRQVLVGELSFALDYKAYPEYVNLIQLIRKRALREVQTKSSSHPIFLTRSALKEASKRDIGLRVIDDFYRINGYEIVYPERVGVVELISKLETAPIVSFISGSGAHNSIFCPIGKEIHIIERSAICNIFQPLIEKAFAHKVVYVQASYSLLPVAYGYGPFLYSITKWVKDYALKYNYTLPQTNEDDGKNFKKYIKGREKRYRYRWWVDEWASDQLDLFLEAFNEAKNNYSGYIGGDGVIYEPPLKKFLKKILRSLKILG